MKIFLITALFVNIVFTLWNYALGNYTTVAISIYTLGLLTPTLVKTFLQKQKV